MYVTLKIRKVFREWDADTQESKNIVVFDSVSGIFTMEAGEEALEALLLTAEAEAEPKFEDEVEEKADEPKDMYDLRKANGPPEFDPELSSFAGQEPGSFGFEIQEEPEEPEPADLESVFGGDAPAESRVAEKTSVELRKAQISARLRLRAGEALKAKQKELLARAAKIPMRRPGADEAGYPTGVPSKAQPIPKTEDVDDDGVAQG